MTAVSNRLGHPMIYPVKHNYFKCCKDIKLPIQGVKKTLIISVVAITVITAMYFYFIGLHPTAASLQVGLAQIGYIGVALFTLLTCPCLIL